MFGPNPERNEAKVPALQTQFERELAWMEAQLGRVAGPYFLGDSFSIVDIMFISFMERLAACLPYFRGFEVGGCAGLAVRGLCEGCGQHRRSRRLGRHSVCETLSMTSLHVLGQCHVLCCALLCAVVLHIANSWTTVSGPPSRCFRPRPQPWHSP